MDNDEQALPARCCGTCRHWHRIFDGTVPGIEKTFDGSCQHPAGGCVALFTTDMTVCSRWERESE